MTTTTRRLLLAAVRRDLFRWPPTNTAATTAASITGSSSLNFPRSLSTRRYSYTPKVEATSEKTRTSNLSAGKIAIAMSGGVDSSVVAYLLSKQYPIDELIGVHMSNWDYADEDPSVATTMKSTKNESYCWEQDWKDASAVAKQLEIPLHHVSFQAEYWNEVFQPYCQKLSESITPNPDVDCNRYIKFGALKDYLKSRFSSDVGYLATGHYARIWDRSRTSPDNGMPDYLRQALEEEESTDLADYILHPSVADTPLLFAAVDRSKDQSYFLSGVPAKAFSGVMFPLGDLYKTDHKSDENNGDKNTLSVRQVAQNAQLPNASKRDSVGICFIGKRKHGDFINEYVDHPLGDSQSSSKASLVECINVEDNQVIASIDPVENPSLLYATIGQGAKLSGAGQKWFVVEKQLQAQRDEGDGNVPTKWRSPCVFLCPGTHHPSLYVDRFYVKANDFNWIPGGDENRPPPLPFRAKCRIRHLQPLVDCEITMVDSTSCQGLNADLMEENYLQVDLKVPLRGVAPGQICVVYAGGRTGDLICMGGGPIDQRGQNYWEMQRDLPSILHPSGHNDSSVLQRDRNTTTKKPLAEDSKL